MASWLLYVFENFPRIDFSFHSVDKTFMWFDKSDYTESLIFWAIIPLIVCLLCFVIVIIVWSLQSCGRRSESESGNNERPAKRRNEADRFACCFYAPIVFLCLVAGVCLYANELANRGMNSFVSSLDDIQHTANTFFDGVSNVNETMSNVTRSYQLLYEKVTQFAPEARNQTMLQQLLIYLNDVKGTFGFVNQRINLMESKFIGFRDSITFLPKLIARYEFERWVLFVILYSMVFVMGIFGLVSVCKRSRKGSIGYGVGGMFIFVIGWLLAGTVLALTLMLADACTDIKPYIESKLSSNATREMFNYYARCVVDSKEGESPILDDFKTVETQAKTADKYCHEVSVLLPNLFPPATGEMQRRLDEIRSNYSDVVQGVSGIIQIVDCRHVRREYDSAAKGLCFTALPGFSLALLFTLIFCITLFGVLIAINKAWIVFRKRFNDYVEVENQDPFNVNRGALHRSGSALMSHDQSNIPADFYGTHVFNPRTRFASAAFTDEPEPNGNATASAAAAATAPTWRNTPPPAYDSMHRAHQLQLQNQRRQQVAPRTLA